MPIALGDLGDLGRVGLYKNNIDGTLSVAQQVAAALSAAHKAGVIHRDIKPNNILYTGKGHEVWVADFGICLIRRFERHTEANEVVGPRWFMAPELEEGGQLDVEPAADIYSLGKLIFYLVTGGVFLPREDLDKEKYSALFDESQQHRILRNLLRQMICPLQDRLQKMNDVLNSLEKIGQWRQNATSPAINSKTLATIDRLRQKQLAQRLKAEAEALAIEQAKEVRSIVIETFLPWLRSELDLMNEHILAGGGITFKVREAEIPTFSDLKFQMSDRRFLEVISGHEIVLESLEGSDISKHILQFYLCQNLNLLAAFGYQDARHSEVPNPDPEFALLPFYRRIGPNQPPKSSAKAGLFSKREYVGKIRGRLNIKETGSHADRLNLDYVKVPLFSGSFDIETTLYAPFRASNWPGEVVAIRGIMEEASESFFEVVDEFTR